MDNYDDIRDIRKKEKERRINKNKIRIRKNAFTLCLGLRRRDAFPCSNLETRIVDRSVRGSRKINCSPPLGQNLMEIDEEGGRKDIGSISITETVSLLLPSSQGFHRELR